MADELEKQELEAGTSEPNLETQAGAPDPDAVTVSRKTLEKFMSELQGTRKAQSSFDKRERGYQEAIQGLQVLTKFNELPDEEKSGLANLAEFSRSHAAAVSKAYGLTQSDMRYLSTLPWRQIEAEAQRIAQESGTGAGSADDELRKQLFGETTTRGSADARIPDPRGQRSVKGGYKNLDAALEAALRMPPDKAKVLLQEWGIGN